MIIDVKAKYIIMSCYDYSFFTIFKPGVHQPAAGTCRIVSVHECLYACVFAYVSAPKAINN